MKPQGLLLQKISFQPIRPHLSWNITYYEKVSDCDADSMSGGKTDMHPLCKDPWAPIALHMLHLMF